MMSDARPTTSRLPAPGAAIPREMIYRVRECHVMLDRDLATLYGTTPGRINQAYKRNKERFPADFAFLLKKGEVPVRSQNVTLEKGKHYRYLPRAFTEHGALMLANVLRSERAVQASIAIVRAFVEMRDREATRWKAAREIGQLRFEPARVLDEIRRRGYPVAHATKEMGLPPSTVKSWQYRGGGNPQPQNYARALEWLRKHRPLVESEALPALSALVEVRSAPQLEPWLRTWLDDPEVALRYGVTEEEAAILAAWNPKAKTVTGTAFPALLMCVRHVLRYTAELE